MPRPVNHSLAAARNFRQQFVLSEPSRWPLLGRLPSGACISLLGQLAYNRGIRFRGAAQSRLKQASRARRRLNARLEFRAALGAMIHSENILCKIDALSLTARKPISGYVYGPRNTATRCRTSSSISATL